MRTVYYHHRVVRVADEFRHLARGLGLLWDHHARHGTSHWQQGLVGPCSQMPVLAAHNELGCLFIHVDRVVKGGPHGHLQYTNLLQICNKE